MLSHLLRRTAVAGLATIAVAASEAAEPPGLALKTTVELSPGVDVYAPSRFALNRTTHRLYVFGTETGLRQNFGIKILDSASGAVLDGVNLGRYSADPSSAFAFYPKALAVDESAAPAGDKVYVLGSPGGGATSYVRVLEGQTGASLTTEGSDILLPLDGFRSRAGIVVNPSNHKVYVVDQYGKIAVVDGPNRKVIATLQTAVGRGAVLASNPAGNKVLVFGERGGAIIDCTNESFTEFEFAEFNLEAAAFHPGNNRVYLTGTTTDFGASVILAVDGSTGATIQLKTSEVPANASGIVVDAATNLVYVAAATFGTPGSISTYNATDLSPSGSYNISATTLALDPVNGGRLFFLDRSLTPEVGTLSLATGAEASTTIGYKPFGVALNSATRRLYVTDRVTPEMLVLDSGTHHVVARVRLEQSTSSVERGLAVSERLNRVYVTRTVYNPETSYDQVYLDVFNGQTNQRLESLLIAVQTFSANGYVAIDDVRRRLYVVGSEFNAEDFSTATRLRVFDSDTHAPITTIPLPGGVTGLGVNTATGRIYVAGNTAERPDAVTIINGETYSIVTTLPAGIGAGPMAINKATNKIYIANALRNSVTVIDGATDSNEPSLLNTEENNGNNASAVAVDESSNRVFIADASNGFDFTGRVNVFDMSNDRAYLGQIELGRYPTRILFDSTSRQLFVTNDDDGTLSVLQAGAPPPATLVNISTRLRVGQGDDVIIAGFIITGDAPSKRVVVRAIGPSLGAAGVSGALQDPYLELYEGSGGFALDRNNDWQEDSFVASELQSVGLAPSDAREAAIIRYLAPGAYTALLAGAGYGTPRGGGTGVALVEVYGLDRFSPVQIVNISTRGRVETGDNVMIGGLILQGDAPARVIVRAIGPSLTSRGVPGALQDPTLELYDRQGQLVRSNDNWRDSQESEITATTIPPADNKEAAIVASLSPGNYTAIVRGKGNTTGVALVEAYNLR